MKKNPILFTELIKRVCVENGYIKSYLVGSLEKMEDHKLGSDRNKKVRRICELLRSNKNIVVVNKSPIKLQFRDDGNDQSLPPPSSESER